jgi:hypothetical protein
MALTIAQQEQLRALLERGVDHFFRKRSTIITTGAPTVDATGLLVVLASWVGDLIAGAPDDMRDDLFLSFADTVVTVAGIKDDDEERQMETLQ